MLFTSNFSEPKHFSVRYFKINLCYPLKVKKKTRFKTAPYNWQRNFVNNLTYNFLIIYIYLDGQMLLADRILFESRSRVRFQRTAWLFILEVSVFRNREAFLLFLYISQYFLLCRLSIS